MFYVDPFASQNWVSMFFCDAFTVFAPTELLKLLLVSVAKSCNMHLY